LSVLPGRKIVDLWAEPTEALGFPPDVTYVLVFENRGTSVGATIEHSHGQIDAFDEVPSRPLEELERGERLPPVGDRLVSRVPGWRAWVPGACMSGSLRLIRPPARDTRASIIDRLAWQASAR
jgi:galactose-1-phosphate uridylyltransferase-like protein